MGIGAGVGKGTHDEGGDEGFPIWEVAFDFLGRKGRKGGMATYLYNPYSYHPDGYRDCHGRRDRPHAHRSMPGDRLVGT